MANRSKTTFPIILFSFFCLCGQLLLPGNQKISARNFEKGQYSQTFQKAEDARKEGDFPKALDLLAKTLDIAKKIQDREKVADSLMHQGLLHWNMGQLDQSKEKYLEALKQAGRFHLEKQKNLIENILKVFDLYKEGKSFRGSGKYQESIDSYQKAISIAQKIGSPEHELKCLRQMSITYWELNNLQMFYALNEKALSIARLMNHKKEEGRCLNNLGLYFWKLDNYSKALNYYEQSLEIAKNQKNHNDQSDCLNNIGIIYKNMGNYDKSLDYHSKALELGHQLKDIRFISSLLNNIGNIFWNKGLLSNNNEFYKKALKYYKDSLNLSEKNGDTRTEIEVLNNIGSIYSILENYNDALRYYQLGYKKAEELHYIEAMSMILNNIGIVHFNLGDYEESTKSYQKAIDLALDFGGGQILWEAYLEIARAYVKQKKYTKALTNFKNSIQIIENIRSQIALEELKASFLGTDKRIETYHDIIDLLVTIHRSSPEKGFDREAFFYLERAKARAFLDSLEISQVNFSQGIDFKLLNQEKELMKDISNIYVKLLAAELTEEEKLAIRQKLKDYEDKLESLKREIRTQSPAYAHLKYPEVISLEKTQKNLLDEKTAFFAYSIGKDHSYAFVITKKQLKIFPVLSKNILQAQVMAYLKNISDKDSHDFSLGYKLFTSLVLPGLDKSIKNIIFIPDDVLHFLPFETLITQNATTHWLIQDFKIAYSPSITSLREIIKHKNANGNHPQMDILAVGDPDYGYLEKERNGNDIFQNFFSSTAFNFYRLTYSGIETERIAALFPEAKRNIFRRQDASEDHFKSLNLDDYKIIHFATHSLIDDKKPARSSIVFSLDSEPNEDGFLQTREIYNLKLNADLVTLSACQTGLGQFIKGEGIDGLNRAFFYAGTSSVLMSLWAVNDQATYQLMERFYSHVRSSDSIRNALHKAKLEMIKSGTLSHPYYWAGFIVTGKSDQVLFANTKVKLLLIGAFLLLAGGLIVTLAKRSKYLAR